MEVIFKELTIVSNWRNLFGFLDFFFGNGGISHVIVEIQYYYWETAGSCVLSAVKNKQNNNKNQLLVNNFVFFTQFFSHFFNFYVKFICWSQDSSKFIKTKYTIWFVYFMILIFHVIISWYLSWSWPLSWSLIHKIH